jgi:hypothetical protein
LGEAERHVNARGHPSPCSSCAGLARTITASGSSPHPSCQGLARTITASVLPGLGPGIHAFAPRWTFRDEAPKERFKHEAEGAIIANGTDGCAKREEPPGRGAPSMKRKDDR